MLYHWEHHLLLPWPDVNLPHGSHLNPDRVPVSTVSPSDRTRATGIHNRRAALLPALYCDPDYALNSPMWDVWFTTKHNVGRLRSVMMEARVAPPPVVVKKEAGYLTALEEATRRTLEESEHEEMAH